MATASYESALQLAASLSREEQLRLIEELTARSSTDADNSPPEKYSLMDLCGLGKEIWEGIDAQEYVNRERASWNG
jgi:hypothetical protein